MRQSIAPGRPSMAGHRSTGLSTRFSVQPIDFNRYSVIKTGTGQRRGMAMPKFANLNGNDAARKEHAKELEKFFKEHNATFQYSMKMIHDSPARNEFAQWFEFLIKMLNRNYELPSQPNAVNDEVLAVTNCLSYPYPLKGSNMAGLNAPHQWPKMLAMLDWLRNLVLTMHKDMSVGNEIQDYTFKYAFDCYKQDRSGNGDYSKILNAIREIIVSGGSQDLDEEIRKAQQAIEENESKLEVEKVSIAQTEKEIADYQREIDSFASLKTEMKSSINTMESQIDEADSEIKLMQEKIQLLRAENEGLTKQVASQPMSSHEAHELLQKRGNLRDEFKEKKTRHEKLYRDQAESSKRLKKLATEKTELYRRFCSDIFQYAQSFNAEPQYRNFECALFGKSASVDSLRASHLDSEITEMFRALMNGIRSNIQRRLEEIKQERLDGKLKKLENDNRMRQQQVQQTEQRNAITLKTRNMDLREAENQLKMAQSEYDMGNQRLNEMSKQNDIVTARADAQATTIKQLEGRLANIDMEETELLNKFADYILESTTHFESLSKTNEDLLKQKEMLLKVCKKIVEHINLLTKEAGAECQLIRADFAKFEKLPEKINGENWK